MKEFRFSYFTVNNTVTIDEHTIRIKSGPFIKKELLQNNLQHFYLFDNKDYHSVFLLYTDDKGKSKKIQVFATPAESGFMDFSNELQQRFPGKSLNHLTEAEAFEAMKTANPKKWAPVAAFLVIALVMAGILYPALRHYFDFGFAKVTVKELVDGKFPDSRNISISGVLLNTPLEETTTRTKRGNTTTTVSDYIPLVDETWEEGDPVKVILSFDELSTLEYTQLFNTESHLGVIRNIAWEGLEKSQSAFFKDHYGLTIDKDVVLVEITNKTHNDEWAFFGFLLVLGILGIVFVIVAVKRKRK